MTDANLNDLPHDDATALLTRRRLLSHFGQGIAGVALTRLLLSDGLLRAEEQAQARRRGPHFPPRALRAVHIYLGGGLSQVDSFDYKPQLFKRHGEALPSGEGPELDTFSGNVGLLHRPHWDFQQRGKSGLWVSDLFPHLARVADELAVIRSNISDNANHTPSTYQAITGFRNLGFPSVGAWTSYGLGSEADNLPSFVVFPDERGVPVAGANLWGSAFLPAEHQGVPFRSIGEPITNLQSPRDLDERTRLAQYELLEALNRHHMQSRQRTAHLAGRIQSYRMAAAMQLSAPEVATISDETAETHKLYGLDRKETAAFGRSCLLTRRLLERGVRFVQLWAGTGISWDSHENVPQGHGDEAKRIDRPLAGLIQDLRLRGMLDDTLVICSTEFGRTPFAETAKGVVGRGRDHNATAFTNWLAGGGVRGGTAYGATDDFGYAAVENPVAVHDFHATILHLLGIDHEKLTYYHNGIERRLTNVHGHVIQGILA